MMLSRRKLLQMLAASPGLACVPYTSANALNAQNPRDLYGSVASYGIYRKNKLIGEHEIRFSGDSADLSIDIESDIVVRILKVPVFRFNYQSSEQWNSGVLQSVLANVNENGKKHAVSATRSGATMLLQDRDGNKTKSDLAFTSNHWNKGVLGAKALFNTLTGKANQIILQELGPDTLIINNESISTNHFRFAGDLKTDTWYDEQGRWAKLQFKGNDGSTIEYVSKGFKL